MSAVLLTALLPLVVQGPAAASTADEAAASTDSTRGLWDHVTNDPADSHGGHPATVTASHLRSFTLDRGGVDAALDGAPLERSRAAGRAPLALSLPKPDGGFARFALAESPVMAPGLAARHPEIRTYSGRGIDDPDATLRADLTPLGFHASVRSPRGAWYIDPLYHSDQSLYVSYFGHDLTENPHGTFVERDGDAGPAAAGSALGDGLEAEDVPAGPEVQLRTYRLALVSDPSYANYFGAANVTAAKVTLMNRVDQVYEDETAIRMVLVDDNDKLNLNTDAVMTGANGPCGTAACYTAAQASGCASSTLTRNRIVIGQLIGASNYDIGHIGFGLNGGGVASLGVVGGNSKAQGCTGIPTPEGDFFAVDYVAHEMGHQFAGNHTFNGNQFNCSGGNRSGASSVEPGSGSSIMAYAGICQQDDLQPHSDPYWSQRSFTEITTYTSSTRPAINEVQNVSLREFDTDGDSFTLNYNDTDTAAIVRGVNYNAAGIAAALLPVVGSPVTVAGFGGGAVNDNGFQVTFNGPGVAQVNVDQLALTNVNGTSGFVGETAKGGPIDNQGFTVTGTGNHAPVVTAPGSLTIPVQTPFALTGSATDADGDAVTYMWEQNDRGGATGTALVNNTKLNGPLFRQFGTAAIVSPEDTLKSPSPGENAVTTDPTRVFPDMAQILADNTNAVTGSCPAAPVVPAVVPAPLVDCYSEFLPTPDWVGFPLPDRTMHFRLTARDAHPGGGGVGSADTAVAVAPTAGPFLVTSQSASDVVDADSTQTVTWDVANTDVAPVSTSNVKISLSTDGGLTYPHVLAETTANDGSEQVTLPNVGTEHARIKVEAVDNVFFDVNGANFTVRAAPVVTNDAPGGAASVQYSDALSPAVTISASDADSRGSALTADAAGLPAELALTVGDTSADDARPGTRSWTVTGNDTAARGSYPVEVTVTDETGNARTTSFTVTVAPEDGKPTYTGDVLAFAPAGRSTTSAVLRATVQDSAVLPASGDSASGDIRNATVTFTEGSTVLCGPVPVALLGSSTSTGTASCIATLSLGAHQVSMVVAGYYTGSDAGTVEIVRPGGRVEGVAELAMTGSAGSYAATSGSRSDIALDVRQGKGRKDVMPEGDVGLTFVSGGHRYAVLSQSIRSLGTTEARADLRALATLVDVTDKKRPRVVGSDLTLQVTMTDDEVASDTLGFTLLDGNTLLISSSWDGARTVERRIGHGDLKVE